MSMPSKPGSKAVQDSKPWWREPWPWILMAGPAAAVVGCIITIVLAFQNMGNQAINDGGVKHGLVVTKQVQAPEPDPPK
ncbi:MAG: hypothetical protein WBF88_02300 [Pusillimonas sp.]